jgi:peptidyl-prolyl cis-trans isomerase C
MNYKKSIIGIASLATLCVASCNDKQSSPEDSSAATPNSVNEAKTDAVKPAAETAADPKNETAKAQPAPAEAPSKPMTIDQFIDEKNIPDVIATIGDTKITKADLLKEIKSSIPPQMASQPLPPQILASLAGNLKNIVDSLVNRQLILKLAEADGFKPSSEMVEKQFKDSLADMSKEEKEKVEKQLASRGSSIDKVISEAKEDPKAQESAALKEWVDKTMVPKFKVSDEETKKFYDDNHDKFKNLATVKVAHILIAPEKLTPEQMKTMSDDEKKKFMEKADADAKKKAEELLAKVQAGADFAKLAAEYSKCPSGKDKGGELSEFDSTGAIVNSPAGGKMVKPFTDAAFKIKNKGDILPEVVKTSFGYHIIKLLDKKEESYTPYDKMKKMISQNLQNEQIGKNIDELLKAAKEKYNVKIYVK